MARKILSQCIVEGTVVKLPPDPLDRNLYVEVKKKLELIGGKWKGGKVSGFVFEEDPTELLSDVAGGDDRNLKKEFQFFATPDDLADDLAVEFSIISTSRILEPSAGDGALVKAVIRVHQRFQKHPISIDCFEIMELNRKKLLKVEGAKLIGNDFLNAVAADSMNLIRGQYDVVIANPPFTKNQDIDHILAMYECLKPGGTLVSLASPSWTFGSLKKQVEFRKWVEEIGGVQTEIAEGAFKDSGTAIRTIKLVIKKPLHESTGIPKGFHNKGGFIGDPRPLAKKLLGSYLREYKGYVLHDAGPVEGGEPGDNYITVRDLKGEVVHRSFFNTELPATLNKGIERAKEWIDKTEREISAAAETVEKKLTDKKEKPTKNRKCRECGCTEEDCSRCIAKTGGPCHWVGKDLCSACLKEPEEYLKDIRQLSREADRHLDELEKMLSPINENDMNFFQQLASFGHVDVTLRILQVKDKLTMEFKPGNKAKLTKPIVLTGTPGELDEGFFTSIMPEVKEVMGLVHNLEEVKKELKEKVEKKSTPAKTAPAKKAAASKSKPAKKKEEKEVEEVAEEEEPSLFDEEPEAAAAVQE